MPYDPSEATRRLLAVTFITLVTIIAVISIHEPSASIIFDKLLPLLTLVIGYYFGQKSSKPGK